MDVVPQFHDDLLLHILFARGEKKGNEYGDGVPR